MNEDVVEDDELYDRVSDLLHLTNHTQLALVVQTLDSAIHRINHYPVDSVIDFRNTYPLDSDLSCGERYPTFDQPRPQYSSQIVETQTVSLELSRKFLTFTLHTILLTQMCPSPSPMLSHAYFKALRRL